MGNDVNFEMGYIHADLYGLKHGAGFILFVRNGFMTMLEGYCYDEKWPKNEKIRKLYVAQKDGLLVDL